MLNAAIQYIYLDDGDFFILLLDTMIIIYASRLGTVVYQ